MVRVNESCTDDDSRLYDGRLGFFVTKRNVDCDDDHSIVLPDYDFLTSVAFVRFWIFDVALDDHRCLDRVVVVLDVDVALDSCCWACCRSSNRLHCVVWKKVYVCHLLFDHVCCPCCFYVVEVEVVVAGYGCGCASCDPQVAGGHRTDHHFHSSDHRRTRADVGVGGEEVHGLVLDQEDQVAVREVDHEEEVVVHEAAPWEGQAEAREAVHALDVLEEDRSHNVVAEDHVHVDRVHEIDRHRLRHSNPCQREVGGWVQDHAEEVVDRVVDVRVTWEEDPAYQGIHPVVPSLAANADRACSFCFAFSLQRHPSCFVVLD